MKSEVTHQVVFLDENCEYANGSELKIWSDGTSQSVNKRRPTTTTRYISCMLEHEIDLFLV
jgi:hypothetical protein